MSDRKNKSSSFTGNDYKKTDDTDETIKQIIRDTNAREKKFDDSGEDDKKPTLKDLKKMIKKKPQ